MQYRAFGATGMRLSEIALGGLLARYEGALGHPPPEEKRRIYLRAAEAGINLFDMGYGDEIHIPEELKGNRADLHFSLKVGAPPAAELQGIVEGHLRNLRRDAIDILRIHHYAWLAEPGLAETAQSLKRAGKVRALCLIRHFERDQELYAGHGPEPGTDADLVIYNYVCRTQEPGIRKSAAAGTGVLIMKALGGQWIDWERQTTTDWSRATPETVLDLAASREAVADHLGLVHPIVSGPWHELAEHGEQRPRTSAAIRWILRNPDVDTVYVAVASVDELDEALGRVPAGVA